MSGGGAGVGGAAELEPCGPQTCADGICVDGVCEPQLILSASVNLSTDAITSGRECAEGTAHSVVAISGASVLLAEPLEAGCIEAGDEVLLINLQGSSSANDNVGSWELANVRSADGSAVTLTGAPARSYGDGSGNAGIGTAAGTQRVALVRVPRFERLVVPEGITVTANAWDGTRGGIVALRAAHLELSGTIDAAELGYRTGRWSMDNLGCQNSVQTEAGESIGGLGSATTARNLGAAGGIGPGAQSYLDDNPVNSTPGHAEAGQAGFNPRGRTLGQPGAAYGVADASRLTLGSGPGGNMTCTGAPAQSVPYLAPRNAAQAGGIVVLLVDDLQVRPGGLITASPPDRMRDVAFSGGYIFLEGATLDLGSERVTALGSVGRRPDGEFAGQSNRASPGFVVLSADSVSGTTAPAAVLLD